MLRAAALVAVRRESARIALVPLSARAAAAAAAGRRPIAPNVPWKRRRPRVARGAARPAGGGSAGRVRTPGAASQVGRDRRAVPAAPGDARDDPGEGPRGTRRERRRAAGAQRPEPASERGGVRVGAAEFVRAELVVERGGRLVHVLLLLLRRARGTLARVLLAAARVVGPGRLPEVVRGVVRVVILGPVRDARVRLEGKTRRSNPIAVPRATLGALAARGPSRPRRIARVAGIGVVRNSERLLVRARRARKPKKPPFGVLLGPLVALAARALAPRAARRRRRARAHVRASLSLRGTEERLHRGGRPFLAPARAGAGRRRPTAAPPPRSPGARPPLLPVVSARPGRAPRGLVAPRRRVLLKGYHPPLPLAAAA